MPLRPTTLRFSELSYNLLHEEAAAQHMPVSQYIREAALMRAMVDRLERGATRQDVELASLAREVRTLAGTDPMTM